MIERLVELLKLDFEDETEVEERLEAAGLSEEAREAVRGAIKLLVAFREELPNGIIKMLADLLGYGYAEPEKSESAEPQLEEKMAGLPEWAKAELERLQKSAEDTRAALEAEIARRKTNEFLVKASTLKYLPREPEELAELLFELDSKDQRLREKVEKMLDELNTGFAQTYAQAGVESAEESTSTVSEVRRLAQELVKSESGLTLQQGILSVLEDNPELYNRYLDEVRS